MRLFSIYASPHQVARYIGNSYRNGEFEPVRIHCLGLDRSYVLEVHGREAELRAVLLLGDSEVWVSPAINCQNAERILVPMAMDYLGHLDALAATEVEDE